MKKLLIIISMLFPVLIYAQHKNIAPTTYDLLIGTYTKGTSKGIYVYRFYTQTGKLAYLNEIDDVSNPSYLALAASNKVVFAVNENGINGEVSSYSLILNKANLPLSANNHPAVPIPVMFLLTNCRKICLLPIIRVVVWLYFL